MTSSIDTLRANFRSALDAANHAGFEMQAGRLSAAEYLRVSDRLRAANQALAAHCEPDGEGGPNAHIAEPLRGALNGWARSQAAARISHPSEGVGFSREAVRPGGPSGIAVTSVSSENRDSSESPSLANERMSAIPAWSESAAQPAQAVAL